MNCEHCKKDFNYPYLDYAGPIPAGIPVCPHCRKVVKWPADETVTYLPVIYANTKTICLRYALYVSRHRTNQKEKTGDADMNAKEAIKILRSDTWFATVNQGRAMADVIEKLSHELEDERLMHAACLTLVEGVSGIKSIEEITMPVSEAMRQCFNARAELESAKKRIAELEDKLQQCEQRNLSLSTLCRIVTSPWRRSDRPI